MSESPLTAGLDLKAQPERAERPMGAASRDAGAAVQPRGEGAGERPIAERHQFPHFDCDLPCLTVRWNDGEMLVEENGREIPVDRIPFSLCTELLHVVAERDRYKALAGRQHEALNRVAMLRGGWPGSLTDAELATLLADLDGQQAAAEWKAIKEQRDALGKAAGDLLNVIPSPMYSGRMPDLTSFTEAVEAALRICDLPLEAER